ncbi:tetratricopeptide repeat protein [Desulfovibrio inopinatus]|uniref:tetratricopeptide repeat protein n=1 Tax=Desulfovibrio inopinatus TaxID=102109 RepID=UPI00040754F0|nr:tetratricopeptide repeat protein [Desulfovibrio inopinatus]
MTNTIKLQILLVCLATFVSLGTGRPSLAEPTLQSSHRLGYTSSAGCRRCHEKFYQLWSTSFHGQSMQPYNDTLGASVLTPQSEAIRIRDAAYRMHIGNGEGFLEEITEGTTTTYRISQVIGGKNVFYFLTPLEGGRLQTMPLAYDVRKKEWFDMAGSSVRHFMGSESQPINWKEWPYTFNTGCYGCHVSQLSTNYNPETGTYSTTWTEPGINCETCHGPGEEHVKICDAAPKDQPPKDMKLIRGGRSFTHAQQNDTCAVCHAKTVPLTTSFTPGDRYFDHYDLIGYESSDFYPDGRDLGENYTLTSWSRSPCVLSGQLDCMHCHTSSGRYRFADPAKANAACSPCHAERVADASSHTHHPEGSPGNRCISCHMPMTDFARMRRSDHSMLPPTPVTTIAFGSPNACNICHTDKTAAWADKQVRQWHSNGYQAPVLKQAQWVDAARRNDWSDLPAMLTSLEDSRADDIYTASMIRLLRNCPDSSKWESILVAAQSPSPLVRAATAEALSDLPSKEAFAVLISLVEDDYRLVRIQAASSLSGIPRQVIDTQHLAALDRATKEYVGFLKTRPDLWTSQYNLGNYALGQGDSEKAIACFEKARQLDPAAVPPLVNLAIAASQKGDTSTAETALRDALRLAPDDALAHFNLALLLAEQSDASNSEKHLRAALKTDPTMAEANYNLAILTSRHNLQEALILSAKALELRPGDPRYASLHAHFLYQAQNATQEKKQTP